MISVLLAVKQDADLTGHVGWLIDQINVERHIKRQQQPVVITACLAASASESESQDGAPPTNPTAMPSGRQQRAARMDAENGCEGR